MNTSRSRHILNQREFTKSGPFWKSEFFTQKVIFLKFFQQFFQLFS